MFIINDTIKKRDEMLGEDDLCHGLDRKLIFWVNRREPVWAIQVSVIAFRGGESAHKSNFLSTD